MNKILLPLVCLLCTSALAVAGKASPAIVSLSNNQGLSNSAVNTIFQDSQGLMWFGTWDGLNRYDGNSFSRLTTPPGEVGAISHPVIRRVSEESPRYLWITTDYGINRLDKLTGTAEQHFLDYKAQYVYQENSFLCEADGNGHVAASLNDGELHIFDPGRAKFVKAVIKGAPADKRIRNLIFDERGKLWIQTAGGLLMRTELRGAEKPQTVAAVTSAVTLPSHISSRLLYDGAKYIWFACGDSLYNINVYDDRPTVRSAGTGPGGTLMAVTETKNGTVIGTTTGCYRLTPRGSERLYAISMPVLSLFYGTQDVLWAGTDGKGVYQCFTRPGFITAVTPDRYGQSDIYPVRAICQDADDTLWIGTKGGGLSRITHLGAKPMESTGHFSVGEGVSHNSVFALAPAKERIWIGTDGEGLHFYDRRTQGIRQLDLSGFPSAGGIRSVYSILCAGNDTIYLGTSGNGLYRVLLDAQGNARDVTNYRHSANAHASIGSNVIYALERDGDRLWIGSRGGGLSRMDMRSGAVKTFTRAEGTPGSLISNDIISLRKDSRGRLWVGTTSGVSILGNPSEETPRFSTLDMRSGLPSLNIHAIAEDCRHNMWLSTGRGVTLVKGSEMQCIPFYHEDGLQDNEFSDGAGFSTPDGRNIIFGGVNGFSIIYPTEMSGSGLSLRPLVTSVTADNRPVVPERNDICVPYGTSSIVIDLAVCDYLENRKYSILYKLDSKRSDDDDDTDWVNLGRSRSIILNRLAPGSYKLLVRVANSGNDKGNVLELTVSVAAPLWARWWAIALYILAAGAAIWLVIRNKRSRLLMRHELELTRQEKENKESTHQAKLRFFTNIAHEFSNSITLIYGAVEQLLSVRQTDRKVERQLKTIRSNAERMRQQISELMEFRKAEQGYLKPNYERADIPSVIRQTADNFLENAESRNITVAIDISERVGAWTVDVNMLEKILFNLMSNALKYTPDGGEVRIAATVSEENRLVCSCSNTGPGIPPDHLKDIFDRFTVLDNFERKLSQGKYSRTGIGLALCKDLVTIMGGTIRVESDPGSITQFTIDIPSHESEQTVGNASAGMPEKVLSTAGRIDVSRFGDRKPSVLIIDDQREIREMIAEILGSDYDSSQAASGPEALACLEQHVPDVIICDIIMPEMNGTEVIKRIRAEERTRYVPVIILSSKSDMESRIEVMQCGANLFVHKPFHPQYLLAAVGNLLRNHSMMREFSESSSAYRAKYNGKEISKENRAFLDKAIDLLNIRFSDEEYTPDQLAADMAISRVQLYRRFKSVADTTPGEFIRSFRLEHAKQMLRNTDKTIQEIMADCGFHNKAYFYRIFQQEAGMTPRDYRQQKKGR